MCERDAETIWMSRIAMNIPNTMKMNAATRLSEKSRGATAAGATIRSVTGDAPPGRIATAALVTAWRFESRRLRALAPRAASAPAWRGARGGQARRTGGRAGGGAGFR